MATGRRKLEEQEEDESTGLALTEDRLRAKWTGGMARIEQHADWPLLAQIPMLLTAGVPLPKFRVRDLLALKAGQTIESVASVSEDVPLMIGAVQLGWIEFEVVEMRMAVRLTRLA